MMMNQKPPPLHPMENVGGLCPSGLIVGLMSAGNIFSTNRPGDIVLNLYRQAADGDAQVLGIAKDVIPAFPDPVPSRQEFPSRMNAFCPWSMQPNRFHLVKALGGDGLIEAGIGLFDPNLLIHRILRPLDELCHTAP